MFTKADNIRLSIPRRALEVIFDECDHYDADETGGRILGTYSDRNLLNVSVTGVIEPGPNARRTATYFKQDGIYQERVFRQIEEQEPSIEHLGNWHTHHVNGLRHLSPGDIDTYRRTVEHRNHNTDFFYALLVIEKKPGKTDLQRYILKNYVLRRRDPNIYEIPASALVLNDDPLIWPTASNGTESDSASRNDDPRDAIRANRVYDRDIVTRFYPSVSTFQSKELGIYWRGLVRLIDGSDIEVIVLEHVAEGSLSYTVAIRNARSDLTRSSEQLANESFASCRAALITTERVCNAELYENQANKKRGRRWIF